METIQEYYNQLVDLLLAFWDKWILSYWLYYLVLVILIVIFILIRFSIDTKKQKLKTYTLDFVTHDFKTRKKVKVKAKSLDDAFWDLSPKIAKKLSKKYKKKFSPEM